MDIPEVPIPLWVSITP